MHSKITEKAGDHSPAFLYNMIPNFLWTILHLTPVVIYCFEMPLSWLYVFLAISVLLAFLPLTFFQLGKDTRIYKKIGIVYVRRYAQDGDVINKLLRKKFPGYKVILKPAHYISRSYMNERFHLLLLVFFLLLTGYAVWHGQPWWALLFLFSNVMYNLYPMFLQQYNRIRIKASAGRIYKAS